MNYRAIKTNMKSDGCQEHKVILLALNAVELGALDNANVIFALDTLDEVIQEDGGDMSTEHAEAAQENVLDAIEACFL